VKDPDPTIAHSILRGQICASKSARADQTGCSAAFGLPKITLYATKQEDLKGSSRPNGLLGGFWSAENHFVRNKTGGFERFEQTKWAAWLLLVCQKLLYAQQNRRICKARADQMGCSATLGLLKITLHVTKQEDLQGSSRPNGLFSCIWSAFKRKCS